MNAAGFALGYALLLGAVCWLLIVLAYRLRDHRRRVVVAFLGTWQTASRAFEVGRWRERLRLWLSMALQLFVVALVVLALRAPDDKALDPTLYHLVILLDTSASMAAREGSLTRWELARRELLRSIESLDDSTEVLLATADPHVTPLLPWTRDKRALAEAIDRARPVESTSDWQDCLGTAASHLSGKSHPRLLVVTDATRAEWQDLPTILALGRIPIEAILVGSTRYNLGIIAFAARTRPSAERAVDLIIELLNDDERAHDVAIDFKSGERPLDTKTARLEARQRKRLSYSDIGRTGHTLTASLRVLDGPRDALAGDDVAYAVLPEAQKTRVAVVSKGSLYLEAAVLSDDWLEPELLAPGAIVDPKRFDVAIYDGVEQKDVLRLPAFVINPPVDSHRFKVRAGLTGVGFDSWNQQNGMLRGLDLYDVQIDRGLELLPGPGDIGLGFSGNKAILSRGLRDGQSVVILGFDPSHSDFVLRPSWPLFVRQVLEELMGRRVADVQLTRPFEVVELPAQAASTVATIRGPSGETRQNLVAGQRYSFVPDRAGLYGIEADAHLGFVAVNLESATQSQIAPMRPLRYAGREIAAPMRSNKARTQPKFVYYAAAALGLLLLEWVAFHRRWTV